VAEVPGARYGVGAKLARANFYATVRMSQPN